MLHTGLHLWIRVVKPFVYKFMIISITVSNNQKNMKYLEEKEEIAFSVLIVCCICMYIDKYQDLRCFLVFLLFLSCWCTKMLLHVLSFSILLVVLQLRVDCKKTTT